VTARRAKRAAAVTTLVLVLAACSGGETFRSVGAPPRQQPAATTPTSTTPTVVPTGPVGNPWPVIGPAPAEHHTILAVGDSLMGQAGVLLPEVAAAHGFDVTIYDAHVNASSPLDPIDGLPVREYLAQQLAAHPDVDTVIFEWLNVCVSCSASGLAYGSPAFFDAWYSAQRALVLDAYGRGLRVVWAVSPPPPPDMSGEAPRAEWSSLAQREIVATTLAGNVHRLRQDLGVTVANWWEALSDTTGGFQTDLWWDGAVHTVRIDDRVHLSMDGSLRASTWTVAALAELYAAAPGSR
jgi:hypothetical protein